VDLQAGQGQDVFPALSRIRHQTTIPAAAGMVV